MSNWIDIGPLSAIPVRGARKIQTAMGCVAVFRTAQDQVFALNNACPHKQGPLAEGIVHGKSVTCPLHNWVFDLETGQAQGADEGSVETFPARIDQGRVLLDATQLASRPAA
ncbi:MAG: nitrite reductase small subunit NirD [Mangrovicoccus sp.]|nr:nitrite reductase small subunit NirD [Mangrovicoccus sp.]